MDTGTRLAWFEIAGVKRSKGDLLAAFELFEVRSFPQFSIRVELKYPINDKIFIMAMFTMVLILITLLMILADRLEVVSCPRYQE